VDLKLIPTFKARYGEEKKMIMVLDNAPYLLKYESRMVPVTLISPLTLRA